MKAFAVQEDCEGTGGIYYADHAITAKKRFANEHQDGELNGITCQRAPWADEYAPGPCPQLVMVDHGWYMECCGCGVRIDSDLIAYGDGPGEPDRELKPVENDCGLFCDAECGDRYLTERTERKIYTQWMCDLMRTRLAKSLPGVTVVGGEGAFSGPYTYVEKQDGLWVMREGSIAFTYPGCVHGPGHLRLDKTGWSASVCHGDQDAWQAWRASTSTPL